jgi:hypothetical protein
MALIGGNIGFTGYQQRQAAADRADYSGVVQAAGLPLQAVIQGIERAQVDFETKKKEAAQINVLKKSAESQIDAAINLFGDKMPGLAGQLESRKALFNDPNISLYEQGLAASSIASEIDNTLNMLLQSQQMNIPAAAPIITPKTGGSTSNYTVP